MTTNKSALSKKIAASISESAYDTAFYEKETSEAFQAAKIIVPLVLEIIQPRSVVDFGCGTGAWLSVFKQYSVEEILGIDGDYVEKSKLLIPSNNFLATNLSKELLLEKSFDLAISLEVAEHLPSDSARNFVASICRHAPVVLFSAAVPGQDGTHHINENWPDYWQKFFLEQGYRMFDPIRGKVWQDTRIVYYYRQNIFLFIRTDLLESNPAFSQLPEVQDVNNLDTLMLVSAPIFYLHYNQGLRATLKKIPHLLKLAIERKLKRI